MKRLMKMVERERWEMRAGLRSGGVLGSTCTGVWVAGTGESVLPALGSVLRLGLFRAACRCYVVFSA